MQPIDYATVLNRLTVAEWSGLLRLARYHEDVLHQYFIEQWDFGKPIKTQNGITDADYFKSTGLYPLFQPGGGDGVEAQSRQVRCIYFDPLGLLRKEPSNGKGQYVEGLQPRVASMG